MIITVEDLIQTYALMPHPEGGYFIETYRSEEAIKQHALHERFKGERSIATAIYFLLEEGNFSAFHRIQSDECWHFYAGHTLLVHVIDPNGAYRCLKLGMDIKRGEVFQAVVPAGSWFASETAAGGLFSFVGCTVAPGFDFEDFELAKKDDLCQLFPEHQPILSRLCR